PSSQYVLNFYSAANGVNTAGLTAIGRVDIEDSNGNVIASQTFTNISPSPLVGTNGFVPRMLAFNTGAGSQCVTIRFLDLTPNGGVGIDVAIDAVNLHKVVQSACSVGPVYSTLTNGSFEAQLAGWSQNAGVFYITPIGVDGVNSADIGGGDATGSMMWQSISVMPGSQYVLSFYSAA